MISKNISDGNSALDAVLQFIEIAKHIYLINITSNLTGDALMQENINESHKISVFNNIRIAAILL